MINPAWGRKRRSSEASFSTSPKVVPFCKARSLALWITGPSATGSLNGTPSSITSAPASIAARITARLVARSGSPQVTYATNPGRELNLTMDFSERRRLIERKVFAQNAHILIAATGDIHHQH